MSSIMQAYRIRAIWVFLLTLTATAGASANYVDSFEGPTLDPFWTSNVQSGFITFPSSTLVRSGQQSVRFDSTNTALNKGIWLEHVFPQPVYGTFSIWVYDTGADRASSNYLYFAVDSTTSSERNSIFGNDYDLGPGRNGSTYSLNTNDHTTLITGVDRTQGWHQFLIDITPALTTFRIDGNTVHSKPGIPMNRVTFGMFAPSWRPAWSASFDDFEFVQVPEPSSIALMGVGCLALFARGAFRLSASIVSRRKSG